ncbi:MAG: hypothetical protein QOI36_4410, partial [Pseudonocardiales bacterium]|nr:hypothetical protein [Pseudonocardiales bacterium]
DACRAARCPLDMGRPRAQRRLTLDPPVPRIVWLLAASPANPKPTE